ncbi:MAG TPA: hypothetical protein VE710_25035 [Candidatus Bathyarchaeia archaeon]|nr:hypothetical protein [Candidatus Bathyarchaeia archaeon]
MMKNFIQKMYVKVDSALHNEKGAQAIEWIALAGVVMAVFAGAISVLEEDEAIGGAISETISAIISKLKG